MLAELKGNELTIIYLEWGKKYRNANFREIRRILKYIDFDTRMIVVDNKMECAPVSFEAASFVACVAGDNSSREFSGWDVGLKLMRDQNIISDVVLFINDTFATHRRPRLVRRLRISHYIKYAAHRHEPILFGQLDPVRYANMQHPLGNMNDFICTYFFGMNFSAINVSTPLCDIESNIENALETELTSSEILKSEVDITYRKHINEWYHEGKFWMNSERLSVQNFNFFRLKIKSVLYEHALALKCRSRGVKVISIYSGTNKGDSVVGWSFLKWLNFTAYCTHCLRKIKQKLTANQVFNGF